jgi:hypothetical protein
MQATLNDSTQSYLHDSFVPALARGITASLERVGKGWFNLAEANHATYAHSKMRKLLIAARFMMVDAVRALVLGSLDSYARYMEVSCGAAVTVRSTSDVAIERVSAGAAGVTPRAAQHRHPLLAVSLIVEQDSQGITFSDDVAAFPEQMAALALRGVAAAHGLEQLEPLVMTRLQWAYRPKLQAVHPQEPEVIAICERVRAAWRAAVAPLEAYRKLFGKHEAALARDNEAHVAALAARGSELSLAEVQGELRSAQAALAALAHDVPTSVRAASTLSSASVKTATALSCSAVCMQLTTRRHTLRALAASAS